MNTTPSLGKQQRNSTTIASFAAACLLVGFVFGQWTGEESAFKTLSATTVCHLQEYVR